MKIPHAGVVRWLLSLAQTGLHVGLIRLQNCIQAKTVSYNYNFAPTVQIHQNIYIYIYIYIYLGNQSILESHGKSWNSNLVMKSREKIMEFKRLRAACFHTVVHFFK